MGRGFFAISSRRSYSFIISGSVVKADLSSAAIWTLFQLVHRLRATYACPVENICSSKLIDMLFRVRPWVLWTVRA